MEAHPGMGHGKAWVYSSVWGTLKVLKRYVLLHKAIFRLKLVAAPASVVYTYFCCSNYPYMAWS